MLRICKNCNSAFRPHKKVPNQKYCSNQKCQKTRRRIWQRQKLLTDEDYKKNQADAQKSWMRRNRGYWKNYRKKHPEYVERNKKLQRKRNLKRKKRLKEADLDSEKIAKMDELNQQNNIISGHYQILPIDPAGIAKMDGILVRIDLITDT